MVNATTSNCNSSDTTCQGGVMERIYKDDGSSTSEQSGFVRPFYLGTTTTRDNKEVYRSPYKK